MSAVCVAALSLFTVNKFHNELVSECSGACRLEVQANFFLSLYVSDHVMKFPVANVFVVNLRETMEVSTADAAGQCSM
jgi:hypothetical protein